MRIEHWLISAVLITGLAGCGGADSDPATGTDANKLTFTTPKFTVPSGDSFTCFYTNTFTDKELSVRDANGHQGPGGHHILAYYTDVPREEQHHPCVDSEMVSWHQISGSSGQNVDNNSVLKLPEGFALKVPAGKQLVIQAHYINTTGADMEVQDTVTLNLTDPAKVENYVNYFVTDDEGFSAPPHAPYEHSSICTLDRDLNMILTLGHMHEYGKHFRLDEIDADGNTKRTLVDNDWAPEYTSHPPINYYTKDQPLSLPKGTRLKQTCSWNNTTTDPLLFPREMCITFMYHFPGNDQDLMCDMVAQ